MFTTPEAQCGDNGLCQQSVMIIFSPYMYGYPYMDYKNRQSRRQCGRGNYLNHRLKVYPVIRGRTGVLFLMPGELPS